MIFESKFTLSFFFILILNFSLSAQVEICDNRIDDDGDGLIDCLDPDCSGDVSCWECATEFYQVHSNSQIVSLDPSTGTYTYVGTVSGATEINGAQFNQIDGHVYAPMKINGNYVLGRLNNDGTTTDLGLALPGSGVFFVGAIDAYGTMFISRGGDGIKSIDLTSTPLTVVSTGVSHPGVADFALDITNGLFYGINGASDLIVFDPVTNYVSSYSLAGSINNDAGAFGACWSSNDGSFFAYNNNSGKIYSVDPVNLTATEVLNGTGNLSINDGFNCVLAPPPFETNCADGIDADGDGLIDCNDPDCFNSNQCTVEICDNGIDDDNDGWADCSDSECFYLAICIEICDNGIDDNGNGLIDGDDPQCNTPSGVTGGLESNRRLSDKIALRNFYTKVKYPELYQEKMEGLIPFQPIINRDGVDMAAFIPQALLGSTVTESAPIDLIPITNAIDVAAADYYYNNQRLATVLGIYSENGVYEHTKYICDRLDGSRLLDMSFLYAKGGNFNSYELLNKYGTVEYALSFSAYLESEEFHVENHWNLGMYPDKENYYNFQIWAKSYVELIILLEDILDKLAAVAPIKTLKNSALPRVFMSYGTYANGELKLQIRNKNQSEYVDFNGSMSRYEGGPLEEYYVQVPLTGEKDQSLTLNIGYIYDMGLFMSTPSSVGDELFVADGAWGIDTQNPNAQVVNFSVYPENNEYDYDVYQVERSIEATGNVKDYLNIYRSLTAKNDSKDLSKYNSLALDVRGNGLFEITLVKSSIETWEEQFRTRLYLTPEIQELILTENVFSSTSNESMDLSDVNMIVFTLVGDNASFQARELTINNVRFETNTLSNTTEFQDDFDVSFQPNPVKSLTTLSYYSKETTDGILTISDGTGAIVSRNILNVSTGINEVNLNLESFANGMYFYHLSDYNGNSSSGKIMKTN